MFGQISAVTSYKAERFYGWGTMLVLREPISPGARFCWLKIIAAGSGGERTSRRTRRPTREQG
jgi:hypothetical protein